MTNIVLVFFCAFLATKLSNHKDNLLHEGDVTMPINLWKLLNYCVNEYFNELLMLLMWITLSFDTLMKLEMNI